MNLIRRLSTNRFSQIITTPKDKGAAQAMLYALGLNKEDLKKPQVGIGSMWFESNPCNVKLNDLATIVKKSIHTENLLPFKFNTIGISDGITMGTSGMNYSLPSRELISDSIEVMVKGHHYDSLICIPGCDKNLPGSLIAMIRINRPGFIIYGGAMPPSYLNKQKLDIVSAFESYGKYLNNEITDDTRQEIIQNSCNTSCGACSGFYTANTMASLFEVMGMTLPNSSSNPSISVEKFEECQKAGKVIKNLIDQDIKPLDILTKESFNNAIKMLYLLGGSTNGVIHLLAIAKAAKIKLTLNDFIKYQDVPVIANMKPHGQSVMYDLHQAGGMSAIIRYLINCEMINGDCLTITGKTLKENLKNTLNYKTLRWLQFNNNTIMPIIEPFKQNSHIKILKGNMAPSGCVSKIYDEGMTYNGKIIIFDSEEEMINALKENKIKTNNFVIIRYQGETVGCPEMLTPTSALVGYFGNDAPPLATDGRFSGGSKGILMCHLPDAYKNNITSILQDGDEITLNTTNNSINVNLSQYEIKSRLIKHKSKVFESDGYLKKFSKLVNGLEDGYSTF